MKDKTKEKPEKDTKPEQDPKDEEELDENGIPYLL